MMLKASSSSVTAKSRPLARQPLIASRQITRSIRMKAAEPEASEAAVEAPLAAEPEDDFAFNLSDARKANEFNSSDIESALRFYFEGGPEPAHNQDTITNLGAAAEDASFFDDIDNNEVGCISLYRSSHRLMHPILWLTLFAAAHSLQSSLAGLRG